MTKRGKTGKGNARAWLNRHVNFTGEDCLIWPFNRGHGYAVIIDNGSQRSASRVMCKMRHGPPPSPKHEAAHNCGKGCLGCVNPKHLAWKTHAENVADMIIHGTSTRGESHAMSKLTKEQVLAIRAERGIPQRKLAVKYGVSQSQIGDIQLRKKWAWL